MPLSRLENFLINTDGNILYVNPSDLDATDSFDNKGNSLTRPFKTIQRALIEAARFSYQIGDSNDRFDRTTILLYPGTHLVDNRRGLFVRKQPDNAAVVQFFDQNEINVTGSTNLNLNSGTQFDIQNAANVLYKFNSVDGGVIVPKGTSIVGLDLRKTKIRPLYVPDPKDQTVDRSALFRITGGCYFWQFSMFDADRDVFFNNNYGSKRNPSYSHHKLTCFEYADGVNIKNVDGASTNFTDLQMYYFKLMNAYGADTGNRQITDFPTSDDFEPNSPEFKIVGDLSANDFDITELRSSGVTATVTTALPHGLSKDDSFRIVGVGGSALYEGSFRVGSATSERQFTYTLPADPNQDNITITTTEKVVIEADNVTGASPYIFNISLRSIFGMCGMHADGDKATGFKSMVVAQFTGIGLQKDPDAFLIYDKASGEYKNNDTAPAGETRPLHINQNAVYAPAYESFHVKASNDAVIQAVSVFAIGFGNHFLAEDGADQSITNSNSNFGAKSLISKGFRKESFNRDDTGYVTHIVPPKDLQEAAANVIWRALDPTKTAGVGVTSKLYILGETDEGNPPSNISDGYKIGAHADEVLYLDVVTDPSTGITTTFSAPILMEVPSGTVDGPQSKKVFTVSRTGNVNDINTSTNTLSLTANHNLTSGESIRIFSDNGRLPDGIEPDGKYYAIVGGGLAADEIKIASTLNNALNGSAVAIFNTNGGILRIESRVTDKIPGDAGHPIQYDSTNEQWFITSSNVTTTNKIYDALDNFTAIISENNATTYVQRVPENRDLTNRIYKLRYVVPKEFSNAKAPTKNFVLQESKTVSTVKDFNINSVVVERNPRTIASVGISGATVTITSEKPHGVNVGDRVRLKNIPSTLNSDAKDDVSFNGYFNVDSVPSTKTFRVSNAGVGTDVYVDNIHAIRSSNDFSNLPVFERNEYKTTFIIQDVEEIQKYDDNVQDGIYYLTVLRSDITPLQDDGTTNPFSSREYKQDFQSLYPVVDRDNSDNDPEQSISVASNGLLGKVSVDDIGNSITKEAVIEYTKDTKVGLAVTGVRPLTANSFQIEFAQNHGLNRITGLSVNVGGAGYAAAGITTTVYNVALTGGTGTGADATANLTVVNGVVTGVDLVDGGSAYGVGNTMTIDGGDGNGVVGVTSISRDDLGTVQLVGVGTVGNRKSSGYNGVWGIATSAMTANTLSVSETGSGTLGVHTESNGVAIIGNLNSTISNIVGVTTTLAGIVTVTTTAAHGLSVGNKIRILGVVDDTENAHNGDHIVNKIVGINTFTIEATPGISWNTGTNNSTTGATALKYSLGATGEDTSLQREKISGSLLNFADSYISTITDAVDTSTTTVYATLSTAQDESVVVGDYIQVGDEVMRVTAKSLASSPARLQLSVLRGVLGTQSRAHIVGSVIKSIKIIPSEVRRFSSIRASGHTFEYIGYGPGNYSTALPQRIQRTLTREEELLSIYCEKKGGVTFFSGMNDRGEFFTWDGRVKPVERYISEVGNDFTGIFDDLYVRNTLRVGGGPNRNLPSEFRGPVNFTNKITNTDTVDGIGAIKLQLKGNTQANPFFQVGPDAKPSLVVNQSSQFVGIQTADPKFELDVNGTIRANVYENFKLTDLPNTKADEVTFERNRVLKVNDDATGYELVDVNTLSLYTLTSYKVSNDGTVHVGTGSTVGGKLEIAGIGTSRFTVGQKVKMFGVGISTDPVVVPDIPSTPAFTKVGSSATSKRYRYWAAQYHLRSGDVGNIVQCTPTTGVGHTTIDNFNDIEHISLTLNRSDTSTYGVLLYRQESADDTGDGNIEDARLVGILGPKELGDSQTGIIYKDFGVYDKTAWNKNTDKNEFDEDQIHFPNSFATSTVGKRRGWNIDEIVSIGNSSITVSRAYDFNDAVGFNTDRTVKVVADNTYALNVAINDVASRGGDYLEIPSGVFLTNKLIIPTNFTLKGVGKNSVIKQQYFANDATDGAGNTLQDDNILLGISTNTVSNDVTISDVTFDGNNTNQYRFPDTADDDSYMIYLKGLSSGLIKGVELRNSPMHGMIVEDSNRVSIENSTFVDGSITDRYQYEPLNASSTTSLRVNDCLFENYPAAVDVSSSSVVAVGGNIIRNCGRALKTFATGKVTTTDNILLGPADEFIPSPDIFDSDFNGINITVDTSGDFLGPVLQYIENGEPKDISEGKVTISSAGIGTMIGVGSTLGDETIGTKFMTFAIHTPNEKPEDLIDREHGYIQTYLTAAQTATLTPFIGAGQTALGYSIVAQEFMDVVPGFSTFIGISTGAWFRNDSAFIGVGATEYRVTLADEGQISGITTGDIVKLVDHSVSPSLSANALTVSNIEEVSSVEQVVTLTGITTTSKTNGNASGYISIRKQFVIAKGRVGVI